ncbi:MAG: PLP-dependent aminotransferase family protein, partial [Eggerthellaceae bacterium]|nr:PLP-dependent aminotransferase family protein [Eggerthellaceae bacterium]
LADELRCSRNTVEAAYQMLVQEGYVASKPGSGYVIQNINHLDDLASNARKADSRPDKPMKARYDFTYGDLQPGTFPALTWRTLTDDAMLSVGIEAADTYTDPNGEWDLRAEIAWRLSMTRGIECTPDQVVVQCGTQPSIHRLLSLFNPATDIVAMEDPGYDVVRSVFELNHFRIHYCDVLSEHEKFIDDVLSSKAKLIYVTPSSQFPTTRVMSVPMREKLINWARETDAYILEDDYCREFRYLDRGLPPIHTMDPERVIYMGTFSKSISPALRMNYLVLPPSLVDRWNTAYSGAYPTVPWLSQVVLTRFMKEGHRDRHLRKQQTRNKRKYETLIEAINETMGDRVEILKNGTGLHVLVNVLDGRPQEELIAAALKHDVRVYDTNRYWAHQDHLLTSCVLVGFSAIEEKDIRPGIKALAEAWFGE